MILTGEKKSTVEKIAPFPFSLPQIQYRLPWVWTRPDPPRGVASD